MEERKNGINEEDEEKDKFFILCLLGRYRKKHGDTGRNQLYYNSTKKKRWMKKKEMCLHTLKMSNYRKYI